MKKLFLLLTLSFFSAQGLAGGCPDGSEPVKSVSEDGTYFVYNCGGSTTSSSETSSTKSNGLLPNTLKQIKVVKDWEPVADFKALKDYAKLVPISRYLVRKNKELNCIDRITNVNPYPDNDTHVSWFQCQTYVHVLGASNPQIVGDILLTWASAKKDPMFVIPTTKSGGYNVAGYDIPSTIGTFAQSYAIWYDEIAYTPEERKRVDAYMTRKLMEQKFPVLNYGKRKCNINNINSVYHKNTGSNNCGNIRMKVSVGEIMLGFRLENQTLLDKGHDDMYVVLAFINEDGININHASRGSNTVNYSWDYTYYSSLLAELYATVGYDYLEHTLPHGAKVHEHLSFNYRLLKDFKLTAPWAKNNVGSFFNPYSKIKNLSQKEYEKTDYGENVLSWEDGDKQFVKAHTKFVKRYMPNLYTFVVQNYMGSKGEDSASWGVHPYMLHFGNNYKDENSNAELHQKQELEKIQAKKAEEVSGLSIFELEGEMFNLALDKVDFIETGSFELERSEEYLKSFQLHKGFINGGLKTKSNITKKFKTLVYKHADTKEQKLVIHVDDPTIKPLKRHKGSLEKKCGSKVMEWGWLSFISKTNDINSVRNQQCIYDYFKEANDKEAWELFQAILGGTDSILDYLQTNVEK
jgi:hypothetical protein